MHNRIISSILLFNISTSCSPPTPTGRNYPQQLFLGKLYRKICPVADINEGSDDVTEDGD